MSTEELSKEQRILRMMRKTLGNVVKDVTPIGGRIELGLGVEQAIKIARLAVHTKVFPLYEVEDGDRFIINVDPKNIPVSEYLRLQGRFSHLDGDEIQSIQEVVDREWERLLKKALY
jgi:hypothetical protein